MGRKVSMSGWWAGLLLLTAWGAAPMGVQAGTICDGVEDCDDNNECTADSCDIAAGECDFTNVPNATPCTTGPGGVPVNQTECNQRLCTDGVCANQFQAGDCTTTPDEDLNDCLKPGCVNSSGIGQCAQCETPLPVGQPCSSNCGAPAGDGGAASDCANPIFGAATGCTVLETNGHKVDITGPPGGIQGDVCIGPNGKLSMSGEEFIDGDVRLGPGATFDQSGSGSVGMVLDDQDLSAEIAACEAAVTTAPWTQQPCDIILDKLSGSQTITAGPGPAATVVCVKDVNVGRGQVVTLKGPVGSSIVFKVTGSFKVGGGKILVASGDPTSFLLPKDVLYAVLGTGGQVAFTGGGGGTDCCKAEVDGSLVALTRKIALSPGRVNGQICSGLDISVSSGSAVQCTPPGGPACVAGGICQ